MEEQKPKKSTFKAEEMRWLGENEAYLEEHYPGMWLAVDGPSLVAVGSSLPEVSKKARELGIKDPLFTAVKRKDYQGVYLIRHAAQP